ncbi:alkaline phosphatase D family protein [Qipengyuania aurantiaca]|uniref:Alkaline phosphatase D family protein n=1 Tax=Qipengyuania aurantiaca TaxID=2867233 RepID=A0ABX8ZPM4_9SPHN|nr:alkaline phosphatase D family protein [Qipengyuania aurantiaca]QZD90921.1 alkaline phosphatase D family protein [Qipengyuania aurantiaca]
MSQTEPPASPRLPALDRRSLLRGGLLGGGLFAAPLAAQFDPGAAGFTHGVASGEPGHERVLLWTRYRAAQDVTLTWQVLSADANRRVVAEGEVVASPVNDWCCKPWAEGLAPGRWYYFRFIAPDGTTSDLGRTRTLPRENVSRWKMAVFSCSNLGFGWFNAYARAAETNQFDCVLHLGDYLYEYPQGTYPGERQTVRSRAPLDPQSEVVALADYRARYAQYRSDPDLRRIHQLYPMIAGWDDHESSNDSWEGGAQNHQPETEGPWSVRKAAAMKAYREWMPVSDEPWAEYQVGDLATLFRLETRLSDRSKQFDYNTLLRSNLPPEEAIARLEAFRDGDYIDPSREVLGMQQQAWLADGFKRSKASGTKWQVLVQQVLMGKLASATSITDTLPDNTPDYIRERVVAGALASRAELPLNMDAWDGYPAARARLFEAALAADANLVSLAGDTHNAWAFDLAHEGAKVGVEFGGHSVTSPGLEGYLPHIPPETVAGALVARNPELKWMNASKRGYMAIELTPGVVHCDYHFMHDVRSRNDAVNPSHRVTAVLDARELTEPCTSDCDVIF